MIRLPRRLGFHHRIQNHKQLSHCGDQSNLSGFSAVPQPLVELSTPLVVLDGRHGRHVKRETLGETPDTKAPNLKTPDTTAFQVPVLHASYARPRSPRQSKLHFSP
jgi:hypothetical protein